LSIVIMTGALIACSGGGSSTTNVVNGPAPGPTGDGNAANGTLSVSSNTLVFAAVSAGAATPASQGLTMTLTNTGPLSGTLFVVIDTTGPAVASVSASTLGGSLDIGGVNNRISGASTVVPASPAALGAGSATATIRVRACLNDSTCNTNQLVGSPQIVNVSYTVGAAGAVVSIVDAVTPHAATAGVAGQVLIRGQALGAVTSVRFGDTPASTVAVVSPTEVRASYPALAAGSYPVALNGGAVGFTGSMVAVAAPNFAAQMLTYPGTAPQRISALLYDDERRALLVGLSFPSSPGDNRIVRYTNANGTWSGVAVSVPNLRDAVLANDGSRVIAVTDTTVQELAADTLLSLRSVPAPAISLAGAALRRIALANNGRAVIATGGNNVSGNAPAFLYTVLSGTFAPFNASGIGTQGEAGAPGLIASADGSHVYVTQSVTPAQAVLDYNASTDSVTTTTLALVHKPDQALALDQRAGRLVAYSGGANPRLFDSSFNGLGTIPLAPLAVSINRQATRAYVLDAGSMFFVFDLTAGTSGGNLVQLGNSQIISTPGTADTSIKSVVTADGKISFMAGVRGVVVIPNP
jgi:hypothetical protein